MHVWCRQELEVLEGAMEEARAHARSAEHRASVLGKELEVSCIPTCLNCILYGSSPLAATYPIFHCSFVQVQIEGV